ncbi:PAAR domain-containing protein [Saccharicrinis aurantiacus]|uniref:PAAR domain-containing protein n=1 Tax=Saccharicrinis aurantiacus TaxID=1849719 RepID=UPI0024901A69|nr:PAAR domain-containing protein [Saccharicrinis aurantiacus]
MPGPAATLGSMHVCPMLNPGTPPPPHVGGPVSGPGVPTVLIGGKPAAVMGDMCTCAGPPDTIAMGEATVLIGGKPAATMGSTTAHGGSITVGEPTVLIGTGGSGATAVQALSKIPFPEITPLLRTVAAVTGRGSQLKEAETNQATLRQQAEEYVPEPRILSVEIIDDETEEQLKENDMVETITVKAVTQGIPNGDSISFNLKRIKIKDNEGNKQEDEEVVSLTGTVNNDEAIVEYEIPNYNNLSE